MSTKIGTFQVTTAVATTEIQVTGVGFRPDAVFFSWTGINANTDSGPGGSDIAGGFGYMLSNAKRGFIGQSIQDNSDPYAVLDGILNTACIGQLDYNGTTQGLADFVSMDEDGFTVVIDEQFDHEMTVGYTAINNKQFNVIEITEPGSTGTQAYTGAGFPPTFALILGANHSSFGTSSNSQIMLGAAVGSAASQNAVWAKYEAHNLGNADTGTYCRKTECLAVMSSDTAVAKRASLSSFDSDGFTLNWLERSGSAKFLAVVSDGRWYVGNDVTTTSATDTVALSGFTWSPEGALFISANAPESTQDAGDQSGTSNRGGFSVGAGTGASARQLFFTRQTSDGLAGASRSEYLHQFDQVYSSVDRNAPSALVGEMDINAAFANDDITLVIDSADGEACFFFYIAIGPPTTEYRERLIHILHNTHQSIRHNRQIFRNAMGRNIPLAQFDVDQWVYSGAAGFPSPTKYANHLENPNVFYAESVDLTGERLAVQTDRESFFTSVFRRLGRG